MLKLTPYQPQKETLYNLLMIIKDLNIIIIHNKKLILIMQIKVLYSNSDTELIIS
jgi:hypothetical protein